MRIKEKKSQFRRDFVAIYKCEHCGFEKEDSGYDDAYFHSKVIPAMKCDDCGKSAPNDYVPDKPVHPEHVTV